MAEYILQKFIQSPILWVTFAILIFYFLQSILHSILLYYYQDPVSLSNNSRISILIAARNEEFNLPRCLDSLVGLNYPKEKIEILVGDDHSEDKTREIVEKYTIHYPWIQLIPIQTTLPNLKGKQNVLAQLCQKATGDYFLFTDADIAVHPNWAANIVAVLEQGVDLVSGPTIVEGKTLLGQFQSLDWLFSISLLKIADIFRLPITSVGNNMAVSRKAYAKTGGYEALSFSIVEDFRLFKEIILVNRGKFRFLYNSTMTNLSTEIETIADLFRQRKRWVRGGMSGPWYAILFLGFQLAIVPAQIIAFVWGGWQIGIFATLLRLLADFIALTIESRIVQKQNWIQWFFPFEVYFHLIVLLLPVYTMLPGKILWKGRSY